MVIKQWDPVWVKLKATGETVCIKDYKFDPELHEKVAVAEEEEEVKEEPQTELEELKEHEAAEMPDEFVCEKCGKVSKSKAGLTSHARYCKA